MEFEKFAQVQQVRQSPYSGTSTGVVSNVAPPQPHSLSAALDRLKHSLDCNSELITGLTGRLEGVGVLRPASPQAAEGSGKNGIGNDSQLAAMITSLAQMFENNNARLADLGNRVDA